MPKVKENIRLLTPKKPTFEKKKVENIFAYGLFQQLQQPPTTFLIQKSSILFKHIIWFMIITFCYFI